jgi:hypothetical protein
MIITLVYNAFCYPLLTRTQLIYTVGRDQNTRNEGRERMGGNRDPMRNMRL